MTVRSEPGRVWNSDSVALLARQEADLFVALVDFTLIVCPLMMNVLFFPLTEVFEVAIAFVVPHRFDGNRCERIDQRVATSKIGKRPRQLREARGKARGVVQSYTL